MALPGPSVVVKLDAKSVSRTLDRLAKIRSAGYKRRAVRPGVNKSASILNKAAKKNAKKIGEFRFLFGGDRVVITGKSLSRSVGIRRRTYSKSGVVVAVVGPRYSYKATDGTMDYPSRYAALIEGLIDVGDAMLDPPRPWFVPAMRSSLSEMQRVFTRELVKGTKDVIGKLRAKGVKI